MTNLNAAASFQIPGGPTLAVAATLAIEAYDRIDVTVAPGASDKVVEIQPGAAGRVQLLVIKSSLYDAKISYTVSDGTDDSDPVTLDAPQTFIGAGAVGLFGIDPPSLLKFSNAFTGPDPTKEARIEILVGRDATP
jgi:hypothetical protein